MCFEKPYILKGDKFFIFDMLSSQSYFPFPYLTADEAQIKGIQSSKAQRENFRIFIIIFTHNSRYLENNQAEYTKIYLASGLGTCLLITALKIGFLYIIVENFTN
jgi:hypothetical protein